LYFSNDYIGTACLFHTNKTFGLGDDRVRIKYARYKVKPFLEVPKEIDNSFAGFYFEPYKPAPTVKLRCRDFCPCSTDGFLADSVATCDCDIQNVCGGGFSADLSSYDKIKFDWDASSDNTKYISIKGNGRTRIEFMAKVECDPSSGGIEQEISGSAISFAIDDSGLDSVLELEGQQQYVYNAERSFVILGNCEIYTRLQFDPKDGVLDLNLKSLQFSASYNPQSVGTGEHVYEWDTNGYCWMRDSSDRRLLGGDSSPLSSLSRSLDSEGENSYELLDLPAPNSSSSSRRSDATSAVWSILMIMASLLLIEGTLVSATAA
jgi:hypothetical protein